MEAYDRVIKVVEPKRQKLKEAESQLEIVMTALRSKQVRLPRRQECVHVWGVGGRCMGWGVGGNVFGWSVGKVCVCVWLVSLVEAMRCSCLALPLCDNYRPCCCLLYRRS